ncbi:MAG: hypothetical protein ABIQ16_09595 [Polyangiaceae bacterium]
MLRRLFVGLVEGLVIGISLAVAATRGLGLSAPSALASALLGGIAGFVVGLVAGRPVWARDAKTEALLKAGVGALVGVGLSFALRRWLSIPLDLRAYSFGEAPAGKLAAVSLPLISSALSLLFELDNTGGSQAKPRLATPSGKQRLDAGADRDEAMRASDLDSLEDPPAKRTHEKR